MAEIGPQAPRERAGTNENVKRITNPELRGKTAELLRRLHSPNLRPAPTLEMSSIFGVTLKKQANKNKTAKEAAEVEKKRVQNAKNAAERTKGVSVEGGPVSLVNPLAGKKISPLPQSN